MFVQKLRAATRPAAHDGRVPYLVTFAAPMDAVFVMRQVHLWKMNLQLYDKRWVASQTMLGQVSD